MLDYLIAKTGLFGATFANLAKRAGKYMDNMIEQAMVVAKQEPGR